MLADMTEHISKSRMERFSVSALPDAELDNIAEHLAACQTCHQLFVETLRSQKGSSRLAFTLAPEYWLRHEHVEYDQLIAIADNKLDKTDREIIDTHLTTCAECREDVRSFLAFAKQIEPELGVRYGPSVGRSRRQMIFWPNWLRGLTWNPIYAAAVIIVGIALVIGVALLLKRRAGNLEAKQTQTPHGIIGPAKQTPTPENQAVNVQPTPAPVPSEQLPRQAPSPSLTVKNREPIRKPENAAAVAILSDGQRTVTLNSVGGVSGLENLPAETQRDVAQTLVAQNIEQPEIAKELSPTNITLRGPSAGQPFKLLSPERTVIFADRPSFEWEKLSGATAYKVLVGDMRGHEVAKSEDLPPDQTSWTPHKSLKRGETYAWNVIAIVNGKEIVSPGASASEVKFTILSDNSASELEQLKNAHSHLALGVFYARQGMVAEAEREFQVLVRDNRHSPVLKRLLKQIQSWRSPTIYKH